jgi:DNA-binding NarL/FixJ family response regulator
MDSLAPDKRAQQESARPENKVPMGRPLTTREREILQLLALGRTGEEIAQRLVLSPETVQKHVHNAKRKLGARTRAHLIAIAMKRQLIDY